MKGKRTGIEFEKHEVIVEESTNLLVHWLKKPETGCDNIKFINTNGIMAVTGDYGNWIFCREFHPSASGGVSGNYWDEKLRITSTQVEDEFDEEGTVEEINRLIKEEEDLSEEELEYLEGCLDSAQGGKFDYEYFAHRQNCGRFDHEYVPLVMKRNFWLNAVYDGFDEICRRMKEIEDMTL